MRFPGAMLAAACLLGSLLAAGEGRQAVHGEWTFHWDERAAWATHPGSSQRVPIYTAERTASQDKDGDRFWSERSHVMCSLVGPYASFQETSIGEGGAHPSVWIIYRTCRPGAKDDVKLTDLFPEPVIVKALAADGVIAKARSGKGEVSTLKALCDQLDGGCEMDLSSEVLNGSFVFHHVEGDKVAIRIGVPHGCEAARGNFTQLGLLLPIPTSLRKALDQAQKEHTLAMHLKAKK